EKRRDTCRGAPIEEQQAAPSVATRRRKRLPSERRDTRHQGTEIDGGVKVALDASQQLDGALQRAPQGQMMPLEPEGERDQDGDGCEIAEYDPLHEWEPAIQGKTFW